MSRDHTIRGIRYTYCDLCGFTYRWSDTTLNSAGLRVCRFHDIDQGDYKYPPPQPYNQSLPVFYDNKINKYYQLQATSSYLQEVEIVNLGGVMPQPYVIPNLSTRVTYQLFLQGGFLKLKQGVNGKRIPPLIDTQTGESLQLIVNTTASGTIQLSFYDVTQVVSTS